MELVILLGMGGGLGVAGQPGVQILLDQLVLQAAEDQNLVDAEELGAEIEIISIALDDGKGWGQGKLERKKSCAHA